MTKQDEFDKACVSGNTETVKLLIADERVNPAAWDNEAIRLASWYGNTKIVKLLLADERVDPTANDNYAIRWASENGNTEIVKLLEQSIKERSND